MNEWIDYYDSAHSIYVNARHREVHFRAVAGHIAALIPSPDATVLDYSCGEALSADIVAKACRMLILMEPAPGVRSRLGERFRGREPRVLIRAPEDLVPMPDASVDLIVMTSVAQYMTEAELDAALALFRRLLRPQGRLVVGDVIAPGTGALSDVLALLRLGAREGFFLAALGGVVRTALSSYSALRARVGLRRYSESELRAKLQAAGFSAQRAAQNIGHHAARMTFVATPSPAASR